MDANLNNITRRFTCSLTSQAYTAVQSQKAISAYFTSEQIRPFGFIKRYTRVHAWGTF